MLFGQVIKIIAGFYFVLVENKVYRLRASGFLREQKINPLVGDFVRFTQTGILNGVLERKNVLARPKVANVDQVVIICALTDPKFSSLLLDRLLATVESQNIAVILVFTKADLADAQPFYDYQKMHYQCFLIDNLTNDHHPQLMAVLQNKLSVFTGQSGVGKTTTINKLMGLNLLTNATSKVLGRGKHTTRVVEVHRQNGLKIIDTPGFGSITVKLNQHQLATAFQTFKTWAAQCKFRSCIHYKETECFVKQQVNEQPIWNQRYQNYLKILLETTKR